MNDTRIGTDRCYSFGPFRLDTFREQLYKDGQPVQLARRLMRTLQLLVENRDRHLAKSYLMAQLWPTTVVEENNLTVILSMLRKTLGDDAQHPKYIARSPGRGYRFVAEVIETEPDGSFVPSAQIAGTFRGSIVGQRSFLRRQFSLALIGLGTSLCLLLVLFGVPGWGHKQEIERIAVLPFRSVGVQHDESPLGLGMADGLMMKLRNIRHLAIVPTALVTQYQNTAADPFTLAKELHVVSILDGTVQRTDDRVWLRAKLRHVKDGQTLWYGEYRGRFADVFAMQDQIAEQTTRVLDLKLDSVERQSLHRQYTESSEAYQKYLTARFYCDSGATADSLQDGISLFQQAIATDSRFALAFASLAACYVKLAGLGLPDTPGFFAKAEAAAQRALEIDSDIPEAYLPLAEAKTYYDWDFLGSESAFRKSIQLMPTSGAAHMEYAQMLVSQGRFEEAKREAYEGTTLDPLSGEQYVRATDVFFWGGDYETARRRWERGRAIDLDQAPQHLAWIYASQGRPIPMIDELVKAEATASTKMPYTTTLAYLYALQGLKSLAESCLQKLSQYPGAPNAYRISLVYAALGDKDRAFQFLNRSRESHSLDIIFVKVDPRLDSLHSDPRFKDLVRSLHMNP